MVVPGLATPVFCASSPGQLLVVTNSNSSSLNYSETATCDRNFVSISDTESNSKCMSLLHQTHRTCTSIENVVPLNQAVSCRL